MHNDISELSLMNNMNELTINYLETIDEIFKIDSNESMESSSNFKKIDYFTPEGKKCSKELKNFLSDSIKRDQIILQISNIVKDLDIAFEIEAGIFEFTLVYCILKNVSEDLFPAVYNDKFNDVKLNLDPKSHLKNGTLLKRIQNGKIKPQEIAFLDPKELHPPNWEKYNQKKELIDYKKNNLAATDLYQCYKCKERKCQVMQLQTRCADLCWSE